MQFRHIPLLSGFILPVSGAQFSIEEHPASFVQVLRNNLLYWLRALSKQETQPDESSSQHRDAVRSLCRGPVHQGGTGSAEAPTLPLQSLRSTNHDTVGLRV